MDTLAQTLSFSVNEIPVTAYLVEAESSLRFTHRLMAEAIGMSKSSPQNFNRSRKRLW